MKQNQQQFQQSRQNSSQTNNLENSQVQTCLSASQIHVKKQKNFDFFNKKSADPHKKQYILAQKLQTLEELLQYKRDKQQQQLQQTQQLEQQQQQQQQKQKQDQQQEQNTLIQQQKKEQCQFLSVDYRPIEQLGGQLLELNKTQSAFQDNLGDKQNIQNFYQSRSSCGNLNVQNNNNINNSNISNYLQNQNNQANTQNLSQLGSNQNNVNIESSLAQLAYKQQNSYFFSKQKSQENLWPQIVNNNSYNNKTNNNLKQFGNIGEIENNSFNGVFNDKGNKQPKDFLKEKYQFNRSNFMKNSIKLEKLQNSKNEKKSQENIFDTLKSGFRQDYVEYNLGPRFNDENELVPYSIVGKTEWFEKQEKLQLQQKVTRKSFAFNKSLSEVVSQYEGDENMDKRLDDFDNQNETQQKLEEEQLNNQLIQTHGFQSNQPNLQNKNPRKSNFVKIPQNLIIKKQLMQKKTQDNANWNCSKVQINLKTPVTNEKTFHYEKNKKNQASYSKKQLYQKIQDQLEQGKVFQESERKITDQLPIQDKNLITRQERILEKFSKTEQKWFQQEQEIIKKCKKLPDQTLINQIEKFREKTEKIEALELAKTEVERIGNRYWYITLRNDVKQFQQNNPAKSLNNFSISNKNLSLTQKNFNKNNKFDNETQPLSQNFNVKTKGSGLNNKNNQIQTDDIDKSAQNKKYLGKYVFEKVFTYPDAYSEFSNYLLVNPNKQVEIIKKPHKFNNLYNTLQSSQSKLSTHSTCFQTTTDSKFQYTRPSFDNHKSNLISLLDEKIMKNSDYLESKMVLSTYPDELAIQGHSKINMELDSLKNDKLMYRVQKHPEQEAIDKQLFLLKNGQDSKVSTKQFKNQQDQLQNSNKVVSYDSIFNQDTKEFEFTNYQDNYRSSKNGQYFLAKFQDKLGKQQHNLALKKFENQQSKIIQSQIAPKFK